MENEKGIGKFERLLKSHGMEMPDLITFLKNLQDLRSGLIAHRFNDSNKYCKWAVAYFKIEENGYRETAMDIFIKSLHTINTLGTFFLNADNKGIKATVCLTLIK